MDGERAWKNLILIVLLAVSCVGTAWLVTCRFVDPALYGEVVAPVRLLYHAGQAQVKRFSEDYARYLAEETAERRVLAEEQRARAEARRIAREERREARRREREIRRLHRSMVKDQQRLAALLAEIQLATPPLLETGETGSGVMEFLIRDGQEYLTGGNVELPYYNQGDPEWADLPFGRDPIGHYGCGPTALAMLVSGLTGQEINPAEFAAWAAGEGYSAPGSGSYYSIVYGTAEHFGLTCVSLADQGAEPLVQGLASGGIAVALMGPGHFTARGHFILLRGLTEEGKLLVADPNSRENSLLAWEVETVLSELSATRLDGSPLWLLSAPEAVEAAEP